MNTENKAKMINDRIKQLIDEKAAALADIQVEIDKAKEGEENAAAEMLEATERTDVDAYSTAKAAKLAAANAVEMYKARMSQLVDKKFLTEEESDEVITELLEYEELLEEDFMKEIEDPLKKLFSTWKEYTARVAETEDTIRRWTSSIHSNYRTFGATMADGSTRSAKPVPVHRIPVVGCPVSEITRKYYHRIKDLVPSLENER